MSLFQQFNGRYDYTAIGNTLNPGENNVSDFCTILETSEAQLTLNSNLRVLQAYLYWAGSGPGDTEVNLNGTPITADDTYNVFFTDPFFGELSYFSCYADITEQIINEGDGTYQFSEADINSTLLLNPGYCERSTNFGGWSIYIIYENDNLPLNQISLYQGLEIINRNVPELTITLTDINVLDTTGAKIGFLAWEGDNDLNFGETLSINNTLISNPPLNLIDNAFNGTNTFTNSNTFFNGDLDVYDIQDNISVGDTETLIKLTTGGLDTNGFFRADLIIINNIITVLNSQLPDATINIDNYSVNCGSNTIELFYSVNNFNSTAILPANTPISFYIDSLLIGQSETLNDIPINASEVNSVMVTLPQTLDQNLTITAVVDDSGTMIGIITETNEENNIGLVDIELLVIPDPVQLPNLISCNEGLNTATYNLFEALADINYNEEDLSFFNSSEDLETQSNEILMPSDYINLSHPETIYVRLKSPPCYDIFQFELKIENCPPHVPQGFSPNDDQYNNWFNIKGLYDIFTEHKLEIYNRYGVIIFEGNNDNPWLGQINRGLNNHGNIVPIGTYYYILNLNDPNYKPIIGWVYVNY
ncbi:MAG: gliding motility-associated C-terminal domain-containing protein [Winogradskyella sp.]|nr:gliding motility-associated C-terminal domain-containing protein [Winogradskyella sp.]